MSDRQKLAVVVVVSAVVTATVAAPLGLMWAVAVPDPSVAMPLSFLTGSLSGVAGALGGMDWYRTWRGWR